MNSDVDVIWANEGGKALRLTRLEHGAMRIEILNGVGSGSFDAAPVEASLTLSDWRRDRVVAMASREDHPK